MGILQMSLTGAVMILAVTAVRLAALHRLPKRTFVVLWAAVVLRLLLPWSLPSPFSIYSLAARLAPAIHLSGNTATTLGTGTPEAVFGTGPDAAYSSSGSPRTAPDAAYSSSGGHGTAPDAARSSSGSPGTVPDAAYSSSGGQTASPDAALPLRGVSPWTIIWLGGVLACGAYFTTAYLKCRRQFRMSLPAEQDSVCLWLEKNRLRRPIQVRQSGHIASPLTYGVLRPVILLPKAANSWDGDVLDYVLTHEYMHIRHLDAVLKLAVTAAVCIHWFNPLAWGMYVLANRDMELSCDEAVLQRLGHGARSSYASALILMEEQISGLAPFASNFSKNAIEERITAIMKLKKISTLALLAAAGAVICVTAVFATSATELPQEDTQNSGADVSETPGDSEFSGNPKQEGNSAKNASPTWDAYEPFGITLNQKENALYFNDEKIRYFEDAVELGGGTASKYTYYREDGTADLHTVRAATQNPDGSTDPFGTVLGIEGFTPGEAQQRIKEYLSPDLAAYAVASEDTAAEKEILDIYVPFGLSYQVDPITGELRMSWQGKTVHSLYDPVSECWIANSMRGLYLGPDAIDLEAVYESGKLAGLQESRLPHGSEPATANLEAIAVGTDTDEGIPLPDMFSKYAPFGITYQETITADGMERNLYFNGKPVNQLIDNKPDGGVFTFGSSSQDEDGIIVCTFYKQGKLAGIAEVCGLPLNPN